MLRPMATHGADVKAMKDQCGGSVSVSPAFWKIARPFSRSMVPKIGPGLLPESVLKRAVRLQVSEV
jgi:hypothetical protein